MLYPTTIDPTPVNGIYSIEQGCLIALSFTLEAGQRVTVDPVHTALVQDRSLRGWISATVGGAPIVYTPQRYSYWNVGRSESQDLVYYGPEAETAGDAVVIPAGNYFVNVLNMINMKNALRLTISVA